MNHSKTDYGGILLMLFTDDYHYSVSELAEQFETSEEDVNKYLEVLEATGFILDKWDGGYALHTNEDNFQSIQQVLKYNIDRCNRYYQKRSAMPDSSPEKDAFLKRLKEVCEIYIPEPEKPSDSN